MVDEKIIEFVSDNPSPVPGPFPDPSAGDNIIFSSFSGTLTGDLILFAVLPVVFVLAMFFFVAYLRSDSMKSKLKYLKFKTRFKKFILLPSACSLLLLSCFILPFSHNKIDAFGNELENTSNKVTATVDSKTGKIFVEPIYFENFEDIDVGIYAFSVDFSGGAVVENVNWTIKSGSAVFYEGPAGETDWFSIITYLVKQNKIPLEIVIDTDAATAKSLVGKTVSAKTYYERTDAKFDVTVDAYDVSYASDEVKDILAADGWIRNEETLWTKNVSVFTPLTELMTVWNSEISKGAFVPDDADTRVAGLISDSGSEFTVKDTSYAFDIRDTSKISFHQNKDIESKVKVTDSDGNVQNYNMILLPTGSPAGLELVVDAESWYYVEIDPNVEAGEPKYVILSYELESYKKGETYHVGVTVDEIKNSIIIKGTTNPPKPGIQLEFKSKQGPITKAVSDEDGYFELPVHKGYDGTLKIVDPDDPECIFIKSYSNLTSDVNFDTFNLIKHKLTMNCGNGSFIESNIPNAWHKATSTTYVRNYYEGSCIQDAIEQDWGYNAPSVVAITGGAGKGWLKWDYNNDESGSTYLSSDFIVSAVFVDWLYNMPSDVCDDAGNKLGEIIYIGDKNDIRRGCTYQHFLDGVGIYYRGQLVFAIEVKYYPEYEKVKHVNDWVSDSGAYLIAGSIIEPLSFHPTNITTNLCEKIVFESTDDWSLSNADKQTLLGYGWIFDNEYKLIHYDYVETGKIEMYMNLLGVSAHKDGKTFSRWHVERSDDWATMTVSPVWAD